MDNEQNDNQIFNFEEEDSYIKTNTEVEDRKNKKDNKKINTHKRTKTSKIPSSQEYFSSSDSSLFSNDEEDLTNCESIEAHLLKSIKNKENPTIENLELAKTIDFKSAPDKIIETDEYGFLKDYKKGNTKNHGNNNEENLTAEKLLLINSRMEKWSFMIKNYEHFFLKSKKKLKQRTRKGVPDGLRSYVWQLFGEVDKFKKKNLFQELDKMHNDKTIEDIIVKDLDRTFPSCQLFMDKYGNGQRKLFRVLINYSKYNKQIEYIQGMGYIVALFLIYMDEESSFYLLHSLVKKYGLEGIYLPGFPELKKKFFVLLNLEKKFIPKVYQILKRDQILPSIYASEWFICLFAKENSFNILVRIFDTFLLEGYKIIYRFALAFLKLKEKEFINGEKGIAATMEVVNSCNKNVNEDLLVKTAFNFHLSKKRIKNLEEEYERCKNDKNNEFIMQL